MKVNDIIHGFKVTRVRESEELKGTLYEMEHIRTGAELAWLDNGCDNKLFSATFKTLPRDDTGVFHILEHSVLEGSENYPLKEPFLDLIKGSMNTFLNAMTFPDKTMYPVSSRNEQDFMNLTKVYLDAVFRPAIYTNECIFRQEGWHYEIEEDGPLYNGVVFNEMKGAFSSVDTRIELDLMKALFPDSTYGFVSGGDPKAIPDLTYEEFLNAHREFYSPSNCRIYLDGDVPLDRVLALIDDEYLSTFERSDVKHEIAMQKPVEATEFTNYYEIGSEEDESKKSFLTLGKVFSDWSDRLRTMAYTLVSVYLAGDNESPLKRAILAKGLAQDVEFSIMDGIAQPFFALIFRNMDASDKDEILRVYREVLQKIHAEGVDREALTGCLNRFEFSLRETGEPQGLTRNINAMNSWLYGGDIMTYLESNELVRELRGGLNGSLYDDIISELLDDSGTVILTTLPSKTLGDEEAEAEYRRVTSEYSSFSEEELKGVEELFDRLRTWQDTPDSEEAKATLPMLKLSDVDPKPQWVDTEVRKVNGVDFLYQPIFTNGVVHVNLYFSVSDMAEDDLRMLSAMTEFIGLLPTSRHSSAALQNEIRKIFGGINYNIISPWVKGHNERVRPFFTVNFSVLEENLDEALGLVTEILTETDFNSQDIILENLLQTKEVFHQNIMASGNQYASRRVLSNYTAAAYLEEKINGLDFVLFLKDLLRDFEEKAPELIDIWHDLAAEVFCSSRMIVGETSTESHPSLERLATELPLGKPSAEYMEIATKKESVREAIFIPAGISFASFGSSMLKYGYEHGGRFQVLSQIMSFGYLWEEIRVKGGAYGCGFSAGMTGNMVFTSYRDPNPMNSLEVYRNAGDFIRDLAESDEDITRYIISSIAGMDGLVNSARRGYGQELNWIRGTDYDDLFAIRQEMLSVTKDDLAELADLFDKLALDGSVCIVGNKDAIQTDDSWTVSSI
ncbi:MAG: insulinase family protein [Firmicutes bacterium]|nr:insulinase family protein [Bacillota bacterium]